MYSLIHNTHDPGRRETPWKVTYAFISLSVTWADEEYSKLVVKKIFSKQVIIDYENIIYDLSHLNGASSVISIKTIFSLITAW